MKTFQEFLTEESKASAGAIAQHNGNMSEIAFNHAVQRYYQYKTSNPTSSHEEALNYVKSTRPLRPSQVTKSSGNHRFKSMVEKSINAYGDKKVGHKETTRTLWDGHHAAIDVLNHIHNNYGPITGKPFHTGPDASGEMAKKLTGAKTTADVLIPYKDKNTGESNVIKINASGSGKGSEPGTHIGASLKYSTSHTVAPAKIRGHGLPGFYAKIQDIHKKIFGEEHHGLRNAMDAVSKGPDASAQAVLEKHHDFLHGLFGTNPKSGQAKIYDLNKSPKKAAVFTHDPLTGKRSLNPGAQSVLRKVSEKRVFNLGLADGHTPDLHSEKAQKKAKEVYGELHAGRKDLTGPISDNLHDALRNIVHNHDSENPKHVRAVHDLARHISNVAEPRSKAATSGAKTLLVSIKRQKDVNGKRQKPKTYIGNPVNAHRNYIERSKRNGATAKEMFAVSKSPGANNIKFGDATISPYINDAGNGSVGITHSHNHFFA